MVRVEDMFFFFKFNYRFRSRKDLFTYYWGCETDRNNCPTFTCFTEKPTKIFHWFYRGPKCRSDDIGGRFLASHRCLVFLVKVRFRLIDKIGIITSVRCGNNIITPTSYRWSGRALKTSIIFNARFNVN